MIPEGLVTDAVLAHLQAVEPRVGDDRRAVTGAGWYAVLERVAGSGPAFDDMANPERGLSYRCRIRSVGAATREAPADAAGVRRLTEDGAVKLRARLLDRSVDIAGTGFKVVGRTWSASSGVMMEGTVGNLVDEYELMVAPA